MEQNDPQEVLGLTDAQVAEMLFGAVPAPRPASRLLKFTSPTCGMCRALTQAFEKANVPHTTIDISTDDGYALAQRYHVRHLPTVVELDDRGNIANRCDKYGEILKLYVR